MTKFLRMVLIAVPGVIVWLLMSLWMDKFNQAATIISWGFSVSWGVVISFLLGAGIIWFLYFYFSVDRVNWWFVYIPVAGMWLSMILGWTFQEGYMPWSDGYDSYYHTGYYHNYYYYGGSYTRGSLSDTSPTSGGSSSSSSNWTDGLDDAGEAIIFLVLIIVVIIYTVGSALWPNIWVLSGAFMCGLLLVSLCRQAKEEKKDYVYRRNWKSKY